MDCPLGAVRINRVLLYQFEAHKINGNLLMTRKQTKWYHSLVPAGIPLTLLFSSITTMCLSPKALNNLNARDREAF